MHVRIVPKPFSLSGKKTIFIDNQDLYYAIADIIGGQDCVTLLETKTDIVLTVITREFAFFEDSYTIRFLNRENVPIPFKRNERWKHNYEGIYNQDTYTIKENAFKIYTIAKNAQKIGNWQKSQKFLSGNEDNFKLDDAITDLPLTLSLCLIIHEKESDKRNQG